MPNRNMDEKEKGEDETFQLLEVLDDHNIVRCQENGQDCLGFGLTPIQCSDELSGVITGPECSESYSAETENSHLQKVDNCAPDLPLNVMQTPEIARKDYKMFVTEMEEHCSTDCAVEEKQSPVKFIQSDETNNKLLSTSAQAEKVESDLVFLRYLRKPFRQIQQHRVSQVYMLHMQRHPSPSNRNGQPSKDASFLEDFNVEWKRLATYIEFPQACPVFAIKLAQDGFVYRNDLDLVECNFCQIRIPLQELARPDFILEKMHKIRSPGCLFKQGVDCGNEPVPLVGQFQEPSSRSLSASSDATTGTETSGPPVASPTQSGGRSNDEVLPNIPKQRGNMGEVCLTDPLTLPESPVQQQQPLGKGSKGSVTRKLASAGSSASGASRPDNSSSRQNKKKHTSPAASASGGARSTNTTASRSSNSGRKATPSNSSSSTVSGGSTGVQSGDSGGNSKANKEEVSHKLTYADLGIVSEKPKRNDMASLQKRLASFEDKWKDTHAQTPAMLSEAGMYYAGYEDCARCFFCGGGLKNWDPPDNPWIEHARWFPKCAYLRMLKGPMFVEIVQKKNKDRVPMTLKEVEDEVSIKTAASLSTGSERSQEAKSKSGRNARRRKTENSNSSGTDENSLRDLERENEDLKMNTSCKICMDEESSVVFLPCGHLVACAHCAIPLKTCPLCRAEIKGSVRANMG